MSDIGNYDTDEGLAIETAARKHIPELGELSRLINIHLESPPIFLKRNNRTYDDEMIGKQFLADDTISIVATENGEVISCIRGRLDHGNIATIDQKGTFGINFGFTRESVRRRNIAGVVLRESIRKAKERGSTCCTVDFETQNIEGRSFWLRYFSPIVYSMMRKVDDRIGDGSI